MKHQKALDKAWRIAKRQFRYLPINRLADMIESPVAETRLVGLMLMRKQIIDGELPQDYFSLARRLVADPDNNCRWQALFVIGESIESRPDAIWDVISEFGDSPDPDMRAAIAALLLEHLLEHDFKTYFPKVRTEIRAGRSRFIDTLELCSFDNRSGPCYRRAQTFLRSAKRGLSRKQWTT